MFRPRLIDALRHYRREDFSADLGAGLTVGVVALPLAMAFGIASGVSPESGLFTAIVAGLIISALGARGFRSADPPVPLWPCFTPLSNAMAWPICCSAQCSQACCSLPWARYGWAG